MSKKNESSKIKEELINIYLAIKIRKEEDVKKNIINKKLIFYIDKKVIKRINRK